MEANKQDFTHVLVSKDLGERLLAYLGSKPGSEVATLMVELGQAQGVIVTPKKVENAESQAPEAAS